MKKQHQWNTTIRKSRDRDNRLIYQQSPKMSNIEQNSSISSSTSSKATSATSRKENEIFIHCLSVLTKKNKSNNNLLSATTISFAIE